MTRFHVTASLLFLALTAQAAGAQDQASAPSLPLAQLVQDALGGNPSLRSAAASVDEAAAGVSMARAGWYPRLRASESWQRGNQPVFVFSSLLSSRRFAASNFAIDQLTHPDAVGYVHTQVGLEQVLFDGGLRGAAVRGARARATMASTAVDEQMLGIASAVTASYGRLLVVQSQQRALTGALDAGREDLARATRRRDAGLATDADVLALAVHVAALEQGAIAASGDAAVLRAEINRLAGAPVSRAFTATEPADATVATETLPDLVALATRQRPDVLRAAAAIEAADSARTSARAAYLPQVAAQAGLDVAGTRVTERSASWIAGGEVRWSLALGGAERAGVRAAVAGLTRARLDADDVRAKAEVEVVTAFEHLQSARARQRVGQAAVDQARESLRIIRDRFDAGLAPVNDVLRASTALLDAETGRITALADLVTARAALDRAVGRRP